MGRKKRRWAKARARKYDPSIGKLVAAAEWNEAEVHRAIRGDQNQH